MKVLINMYYCSPANLCQSIPIYIWRFVSSIDSEKRKEYTLLFNSDNASQMHALLPEFKYVAITMPFKGAILRHLFRFYRALYFKKLTDKIPCDVFFNAVDIDLFSYLRSKHKKVVVIHDLKDLKTSNWRVRHLCKWIYGRSIKGADAVVAISRFTKCDIIKFYPKIDNRKINVIYNSVPYDDLVEDCPLKLLERQKFILSVNTLTLNKNPITLLHAFKDISKMRPELLVLVGRKTEYWSNALEPYINDNDLADRVIRLENLSNNELSWLYSHASLFVTTSLREGFGYTPIEAAMHCCPVISSRSEALPDTTKEKLYYYDPPMNSHALLNLMMQLLTFPPKDSSLINIARFYKKEYSPSNQYKELEKLFHSTMDNAV